MFPLSVLSRAAPGEGFTPAVSCPTPGIVPWAPTAPGRLRGHCLYGNTSPARTRPSAAPEPSTGPISLVSCQPQCLLDPEMPSACSSGAGRWARSPAPGCERRVLPPASGLGLLLFAIIISDLLEWSSAEAWGWWAQRAGPLLFRRSSPRSCRAWEHHPQTWGEKGPTPFLTRQGASRKPGWGEPQGRGSRGIRSLSGTGSSPGCGAISWERHQPPQPEAGWVLSAAPGAPGRAGRGSRAGTAVWLSEILDR